MWRLAFVIVGACRFGPSLDTSQAGDDAARAVDAAVGDANLVLGRCGTPGAVRDNFDDGVTSAIWRVANATTAVEQGGRLVVTPTGTMFAGYQAKHFVDLTGAAIEVDVPQMLDTTTAATAELAARADGMHALTITQRQGQLTALASDGVMTSMHAVAYDPVQHRHWRIAESGGQVLFQTSPDGIAWTLLHMAATPSFVTTLRIDLGAMPDPGSAPAGSVVFDDLDTRVPLAAWCKADTLHDTFQRSMFGLAWNNRISAGGCALSINFGAHTDENGAPGACFFGSSAGYDLTQSSVEVVIGAITTYRAGWTTLLQVATDDQHRLALVFNQNQMCANIDGAPTCRGYVQAESYWRISEAAGMVTFDTSIDAITWDPVAAVADPFPLDAVELRFGTDSTVDLSASHIPLTTSSFN